MARNPKPERHLQGLTQKMDRWGRRHWRQLKADRLVCRKCNKFFEHPLPVRCACAAQEGHL